MEMQGNVCASEHFLSQRACVDLGLLIKKSRALYRYSLLFTHYQQHNKQWITPPIEIQYRFNSTIFLRTSLESLPSISFSAWLCSFPSPLQSWINNNDMDMMATTCRTIPPPTTTLIENDKDLRILYGCQRWPHWDRISTVILMVLYIMTRRLKKDK